MNHIWQLYLITRLEPLHELCAITLVISLIVLGVTLFILLVSEGDVNLFKAWPASRFWLPALLLVSALGAVLIPTRNDLIFIAGSVGVIEAARAVQGSEIARNSVLIVEQWLREQVKEKK